MTLAGRTYAVPSAPTVVVCVDGFDPEYLDCGMRDGILPNMERFCANGFLTPAAACMPTLSLPNNMAIVTGAPSAFHGVTTNAASASASEDLQDGAHTRTSTILAEMTRIGVRVGAITARESTRRALSVGLDDAMCFSAEQVLADMRSSETTKDDDSAICACKRASYAQSPSQFILDAGARLLREGRVDLLYLSLSDATSHKPAPRSRASDAAMHALDSALGGLEKLGATVAVTGDHGLSDKALLANGQPNATFLGDALDARFGTGVTRVICAAFDPDVQRGHALGSFARVVVQGDGNADDVLEFCRGVPEVDVAMRGVDAIEEFRLPGDFEGDVVVVAKKHAVIGARKADHDLSSLDGRRLRSSGGLGERYVPLMMNRPLRRKAGKGREWRNFDIFDLALNY